MDLQQLVETSGAVAATRARTTKSDIIAATLRDAGADEIGLVARYLTGSLRQRRPGVGWASFRGAPQPVEDTGDNRQPRLTVAEVDDAFEQMSVAAGPGSAGRRVTLLHDLLGRASAAEQGYLAGLVSGELRQGALESIVVDALAKAFDVPVAAVRRAVMLGGELPSVATALAQDGAAGLAAFTLSVGRPVQPMLAAAAPDVASALAKVGATPDEPARLDRKLDGVRVQVHRRGEDVVVASRSLDDLTGRLPEVVAVARTLPVEQVVLDGEVIVIDETGRPAAFQVTASRAATRDSPAGPGSPTDTGARPLSVFFFDVLHVDGRDLLDAPATDRWAELTRVVPAEHTIPFIVTSDPAAAQSFFDAALAAGHEGVVVKSSSALYAAGRRGAGWVKVKPRHTLDLVVLAAEWGHGRRTGLLSNLHLGALATTSDRSDPAGLNETRSEYVMVGKTFKGLTDELLRWQTEQFLAHETSRDGGTVRLAASFVVEIAFDGVQTSRRYPGGCALRFARVLRYRPDKTPAQADTIEEIRRIRDATPAGDESPSPEND